MASLALETSPGGSSQILRCQSDPAGGGGGGGRGDLGSDAPGVNDAAGGSASGAATNRQGLLWRRARMPRLRLQRVPRWQGRDLIASRSASWHEHSDGLC
jgi:hypothetical protein